MTKIVIIEDEAIAAGHLTRTLQQEVPEGEVVAVLQSIEESVEFFGQKPSVDLCFMDIHLADGLSLRIFDRVAIGCPVIFTTAYDQYALEAFQAGGIDYLLKPISPEALRHALNKLESLRQSRPADEGTVDAETVRQLVDKLSGMHRYRSCFFVTIRDKLVPIEVAEVACFYVEDKITRALFYDKRSLIIDRPLDSLMEQLDPTRFFRANRQYIVARRAIAEITLWPISKLALSLSVPTPDRIIISKARVPEFKQWYTQ